MRRIVKTNRAKRIKKYLYLWYNSVLKPLKNIRQLNDVSWKMRAKEP
jgi:hypothetical protein